MQGDAIVGMAVLTATGPEQRLYCVFRKADGRCHVSSIPVAPAGDPRLAQQGRPPLWSYRVDGGVLRCRPSVLERYQLPPPDGAPTGTEGPWVERFHNAYDWDVRFQPVDAEDRPYDQCVAANPEFMKADGTP